MGQSASASSSSSSFEEEQRQGVSSSLSGEGSNVSGLRTKPLREKARFGTVLVNITTLSTNRRNVEFPDSHVITPRGAILYGTLCSPRFIQRSKFIFFIFNIFFLLKINVQN